MINRLLQNKHNNYMIPFFWQHGEDAAILKEELGAIKNSGIGAVCVESRPHPDFLGDLWWRDMDIIMDECRKLGLHVWVFDDSRFPTGYANGMAKDSPHRKLFIKEKHVDILGPQTGTSLLVNMKDRGGEDDILKAVIAGRRIPGKNMDHSTHINMIGSPVENLIDLTPLINDDVVYWDIPDGLWRIFYIFESRHSENERLDQYINYITPEGTDILINTVYEPHYKKYAADFGKTFKGFFSDEPQFGSGYGYHAVPGRYPYLVLPWCEGLSALMDEALGEKSRKYLPGIWYDIGPETRLIRYAYMDALTKLYGKNFASRIGDWCRSHNAEYMGHVIEENNAHARLGAGTGHFFRALWGQDISGIDVVLHGLIPGIKGTSHAMVSKSFEADDDFFYYMLAQMAVSLAHINPMQKGRTMCEIFGAYGWQEGCRQMKWLADFFLVRGVNHYIPHAFSPKEFPDPDCPPHFYARGQNPQYRYFKYLMDYMNRISDIISGGRPLFQAAILYHAEAEWSGDPYMKTQEPVKILNQNQLEAAIIPIDILSSADVKDGQLLINGKMLGALVIPEAVSLPSHAITQIAALAKQGLKVIFVNNFPSHVSSGSLTNPHELLSSAGCMKLSLDEIPDALESFRVCRAVTSEIGKSEADLKIYPYEKEGKHYFLLFNENLHRTLDMNLTFNDKRKPFLYDGMENKAIEIKYRTENDRTIVPICLPPYAAAVIAFEDNPLAMEKSNSSIQLSLLQSSLPVKTIPLECDWTVSTAKAGEYPNFTPNVNIKKPGNLNNPGGLPRFSGTIKYEALFDFTGAAVEAKAVMLNLGDVGECAEVWINEKHVGLRITPPYIFDITGLAKEGKNSLRIEVTNTLVYQEHDRLSGYQAIQQSGLIGPVTLEIR